MLKSYFTIALRNLLRQKGYTLINILGLSIGMAACLIIALYIIGELGYDQHHNQANHIYRVLRETHPEGRNPLFDPRTSGALAGALETEFPEVDRAIRLRRAHQVPIEYGTTGFDGMMGLTDTDVFTFFNFPLLRGNPQTLFTQPNSLVLTKHLSTNLFGHEDPIGKTVKVTDVHIGGEYTVTGILDAPPGPTTIQADFWIAGIPEKDISDLTWTSWRRSGWRSQEVFVRLKPQADAKTLERKFPDLIARHMGEETRATNTYHLQPLTNIYLRSQSDFNLPTLEFSVQGNIQHVYLFSAIAILILSIACINYINLTTARSLHRSREVGLRKTIGAQPHQLIGQFLGETTLVATGALVCALIIATLAIPYVNVFTGKTLTLLQEPFAVVALLIIIFFISLLSGCYPAFILSRFDPLRALQGNIQIGGNQLRKGLIICQFAVTVALIFCTLTVHQQMSFIQNHNLGFNKSNLIVMPIFRTNRRLEGRLYSDLIHRYQTVKDAFLQHPNVLKASAHRHTPGIYGAGLQRLVHPENDPHNDYLIEIHRVDQDYLSTYEIEMVAGTPFTQPAQRDNKVIINEAAVRQFGWTDPVGKHFTRNNGNWTLEVVGVMKDFHRTTLREPIRPLAINNAPWLYNDLTVRVKSDNLNETIAFLEKQWKHFLPTRPFTYAFIDDNLAELYKKETTLNRIITAFSTLSIAIACLGLFGLASFTAEQKTQEIGIRKTLGASVSSIVLLISRNFLNLVLLANLIAWPIAYYIMDTWLQGFTYRISISPTPFIISTLLALLIAFIAIMYQALKAALINPIEALRHE